MSLAAAILAKHWKPFLIGTGAVVAAASLYGWGLAGRLDRDQLLAISERTCEAVGVQFRPDGEKKTRGVACQAEIRRLVKLEKDLVAGSLDELVREIERREGRAAVDAGLATLYRERIAAAEVAYREAEDGVAGDQVGRDWACAVNELGGLRGRGC